jgi:hypothetical protein
LGLDPDEDYRLETTYEMTVATEDTGFAPAIERNNRVSQLTVLDDYFAYDDGSAEVAIEGQPGNVIVQRYTAYVADQLTGIRLRLPRGLGGVGDQLLNLEVYGAGPDSLPGELLYSAQEPILYAEDFYNDSLQAFTSYALDEPLDLPVGDFFIGWRQPTADRSVPVGFDRNNQPEGVQYFDAGSGWRALEGATRGAIMIRPLLSGAEVMPTPIDDLPTDRLEIRVFPNPVAEILNITVPQGISLQDLSYNIYGSDGRLVTTGRASTRISFEGFLPGFYLLECRVGERHSLHKIVKR